MPNLDERQRWAPRARVVDVANELADLGPLQCRHERGLCARRALRQLAVKRASSRTGGLFEARGFGDAGRRMKGWLQREVPSRRTQEGDYNVGQ